jgi:glycosyltransferase involved in cell wall biosynthesis
MPKKKDLVVFPHRLDKEKNPASFDALKSKLYNFEFVKTMSQNLNKKDYYKLLQTAKVVFSNCLQETFGIGTVEAMLLGAIPIVPDRLSYCELYDRRFRYSDLHEANQKVKYAVENYGKQELMNVLKKNQEQIVQHSLNAIPKMAKIMLRKRKNE